MHPTQSTKGWHVRVQKRGQYTYIRTNTVLARVRYVVRANSQHEKAVETYIRKRVHSVFGDMASTFGCMALTYIRSESYPQPFRLWAPYADARALHRGFSLRCCHIFVWTLREGERERERKREKRVRWIGRSLFIYPPLSLALCDAFLSSGSP